MALAQRNGCFVRSIKMRVVSTKMHAYEVRPRKDHRGIDLISDARHFSRLYYGEPNAVSNAVDYANFYSRSHDAVIRVYDEEGKRIEIHKRAGEFKEPSREFCSRLEWLVWLWPSFY